MNLQEFRGRSFRCQTTSTGCMLALNALVPNKPRFQLSEALIKDGRTVLGTNRTPATILNHSPEITPKYCVLRVSGTRNGRAFGDALPSVTLRFRFRQRACPAQARAYIAGVAELVDARDSKSRGPRGCEGSIPSSGTTIRESSPWGTPTRKWPWIGDRRLRRRGLYGPPRVGRLEPQYPRFSSISLAELITSSGNPVAHGTSTDARRNLLLGGCL